MARKRKDKGSSVGGYFRALFAENPAWLRSKSNSVVLARYRQDHGMAEDAPVPKNIQANMANVKSLLRKKKKKRSRRADVVAEGTAAVATRTARIGRVTLETLEDYIDEGMNLARTLDRDGLDEVIRTLKKARNLVVWKQGE